MSALLLCRTFPPQVGGIERYISELFRRAAIDVRAVAPAAVGDDAIDRGLPFPVTRYAIPRGWEQGKRPLVSLAAGAALAGVRKRPGLVFSDQVQTAAIGLPLARAVGRRHVVFAYGLELTPERLRALKRWAFAGSDAVIAISRFTRDALTRLYDVDPGRTYLARPGVDLDRFHPRRRANGVRARYRIPAEAQLMLTVGRLDASQPYKGYERVIRLVARLRPDHDHLYALVAGDGGDRPRLAAIAAASGAADRVIFAGFVGDHELPDCYAAADLFVLPSGNPGSSFSVEGYGIVFAEAAASGVPSVAYALGGVGDAIEDGTSGRLVPPDDGALTETVRALLADPAELRRMGLAARAHAERALGWDAAVTTLRAVAADLAPRRHPLGHPAEAPQ